MLRFPLHPRLARLVVEAESRGVAREACVIAALISERDIRASRVLTEPRARHAADAAAEGSSDLLAQLDLFAEAEAADFAAERLRQMDLDPVAVRSVDRVRRRLERSGDGGGRGAKSGERAGELSSAKESELLISILTGYPDRVARRRAASIGIKEAGDELLLAGGGSADAPEIVVRGRKFLVAVIRSVQTRREGGAEWRQTWWPASAIEPEWA